MTMTNTCGVVGAGVSVGVGDGVAGDSLGEGDGVVVAAGADAHDSTSAAMNRSGYARTS